MLAPPYIRNALLIPEKIIPGKHQPPYHNLIRTLFMFVSAHGMYANLDCDAPAFTIQYPLPRCQSSYTGTCIYFGNRWIHSFRARDST